MQLANGTKIISVEPKYQNLLDEIFEYGTSGYRIAHLNGDGNFLRKWEGWAFYHFIMRDDLHAQTIRQSLEQEAGVKFQTFERIGASGLGKQAAEKVFYYAAHIYDQDTTEFLRNFVKYCNAIDIFKNEVYAPDGYQHRAFAKHQQAVSDLLGLGSEERPVIPVQDWAVLQKEIETIERDLCLYPFNKERPLVREKYNVIKGLDRLEALLTLYPVNPDLLSLKVILLLLKRDMDQARYISEKLLANHPENLRVLVGYGGVLYNSQRDTEFEKHIDLSIEKFPHHAPFYSNKGFFLERAGRNEEALIAYRKAVHIDEDFFIPKFRIGQILLKKHSYEEAERVFRSIYERDHTLINEIFIPLMTCLGAQHKRDDIEKLICTAWTDIDGITKSHVQIERSLSVSQYDKGIDKLIELIKQSEKDPLVSTPDIAHCYYMLGTTLIDRGRNEDVDAAKGCLADAISLVEDRPDYYIALAKIYFKKKDYEDAKNTLNRADKFYSGFSSGYPVWGPYIDLSQSGDSIHEKELPLSWAKEKYEGIIDFQLDLGGEYIKNDSMEQSLTCLDAALSLMQDLSTKLIGEQRYFGQLNRLAELALDLTEGNYTCATLAPEIINLYQRSAFDLDSALEKELRLNLYLSIARLCEFCGRITGCEKFYREAIEILEQALNLCNPIFHKSYLYRIRKLMAIAYGSLAEMTKDKNIVRLAVIYREEFLKIIDKNSSRAEWEFAVFCTAHEYLNCWKIENKPEDLWAAHLKLRSLYDEPVWTPRSDFWSRISVRLASTYYDLDILEENPEYLQKAIGLCEVVIDYCEGQLKCECWVKIGLCNYYFGKNYTADSVEEKVAQYELALQAFKNSLKYLSKKDAPIWYAEIKSHIGYTLHGHSMYVPNISMRKSAIKAFDEAIKIYEKYSDPYVYNVYHNAGLCAWGLCEISESELDVDLSIAYFRKAKLVIGHDQLSWDYANTCFCLADSLVKKRRDFCHEELLTEAIELYNQALIVFTLQKYPEEHAAVQERLKDIQPTEA